MTISSVDSGNLAASFYTLRTGCRGMLREPLLNPALFAGIRDHWQLLMSLPDVPAGLSAAAPPPATANADAWITWAFEAVDASGFASRTGDSETDWCWRRTHRRIESVVVLVRDYMPWLLPKFRPLFALAELQSLKEPAVGVQVGRRAAWPAICRGSPLATQS